MPPTEQEELAARLAVLRDRQARRRAHVAALVALLAKFDREVEMLENRLAVAI
jgi:hypothetical protein